MITWPGRAVVLIPWSGAVLGGYVRASIQKGYACNRRMRLAVRLAVTMPRVRRHPGTLSAATASVKRASGAPVAPL
jgi:uncharacterized membrane protein